MTHILPHPIEMPEQGAAFYSLVSARHLRRIGAPLTAARRSHSEILVSRADALEDAGHARRVAEVIAVMRARFGNDTR
ncbi:MULTISPECIES: hypothetical protein [unclassified Marinovum]